MRLGFLARVVSAPAVRVAFLAAALALGAYTVASDAGAIGRALGRLQPAWAVGAAVALFAGLAAQCLLWRALLGALGSQLPGAAAARVYFVGQLGKYVPGSVWPVLAQMELARERGVPRRRTATAFALLMVVLAASGLLVAAATLGPRWAPAGVLVAIAVLPVLLRRFALAPRRALEIGVFAGLQWLGLGLSTWCLAAGVGADPGPALAVSSGAFALAWSAGVVVVLAPAGAGVREVVLVALLVPLLARPDAVAVALLSRAGTIAADLALAAVAAGWAARARNRTRGVHPRATGA